MKINGLSFTGRETMLTKGVKAAGEDIATKAYEYVGAGKYFPNAKKASKTSASYRSPFEPVRELKLRDEDYDAFLEEFFESSKRWNDKAMERSYALSHGIPEDIVHTTLNLKIWG